MQGYQGVIIGLTGNALPADVQTFLDKGANVVLLKPLDIGVLKRHVDEARRMLQRSESELK
jgi:CheY-like chemotaxis protein